MAQYMTPGVYIEEKNAFPGSFVAAETAAPAFIGYTEIAEGDGKSLVMKPTRITSFANYVELFGRGFKSKFVIADADGNHNGQTVLINNVEKVIKFKDQHALYFYNSIKLFFENGGNAAYIIAVGTYKDKPDGIKINVADFVGSEDKPGPLDILLKEEKATMIVIPEAIALGEACYTDIYGKVLQYCNETQSRFAIFDLAKPANASETDAIVATFREKIGIQGLAFAAAYYPWLRTTVVEPAEVSLANIDDTVNLAELLPEADAQTIIADFKTIANPTDEQVSNCNKALKAASTTYVQLLNEIRNLWNELPPSGAMAGIYTMVDNSRGVWKAPANVSLSKVNAPTINISHNQQENLNVDARAGKSINVIRPFPGVGTLVWGGRTLDGNSFDWRYINVRRTATMIEQSIKLSVRAYVFEPNDAGTWVTIKSAINNFLLNLWKLGALAGASPEQAYDVQIGLGTTMTTNDILDGILRYTIKVAIVRPAEFIVINLEQQMQSS